MIFIKILHFYLQLKNFFYKKKIEKVIFRLEVRFIKEIVFSLILIEFHSILISIIVFEVII